ncbi:MAG: RnfABCDGE type electron transport complex subunit D [Firmicutes bacterium]|nr:RnfABCDGE type electron transport complex subunit D [Bacillota bacterium]
MENNMLTVSSTPHIRSEETVSSVMIHVCIALCPAAIMGVIFFGLEAALEIVTAIFGAVLWESLYNKIAKKQNTVKDFSAVVTGLLLAMNLPALKLSEHPIAVFALPLVGTFFAIIIAKQLFGGLGQNFINPALAGRAFLVASYPTLTTGSAFGPTKFMNVDCATYATPLSSLKQTGSYASSLANGLLGNVGGTIGETCAIALIVGGVYLIAKKIISWKIPVTYILTVLVFTYIFKFCGITANNCASRDFSEIFYGGLMLGAFFMATDYASSPITPTGKYIFGFGCGFITVIIRIFGGYPEGVSYSILLMNLCVPLIERWTRPKKFGYVKPVKVKEVKQ